MSDFNRGYNQAVDDILKKLNKYADDNIPRFGGEFYAKEPLVRVTEHHIRTIKAMRK